MGMHSFRILLVHVVVLLLNVLCVIVNSTLSPQYIVTLHNDKNNNNNDNGKENKQNEKYIMKSANGETYSCSLPSLNAPIVSTDSKTKQQQQHEAAPLPQELLQHTSKANPEEEGQNSGEAGVDDDKNNPLARLLELKTNKKCITSHNSDQFWNFEICLFANVSQVHMELPSNNRAVTQRILLGLYDASVGETVVENEKAKDENDRFVVTQFYTNGVSGRGAQISIYCDPLLSTAFSVSAVDVVESPKLFYNIKIKSGLVCGVFTSSSSTRKKNKNDDGGGGGGGGNGVIHANTADDAEFGVSILDSLSMLENLPCASKSMGGWWSFEVCPGRQVRQFHGKKGAEDFTEHLLGVFTSSHEIEDIVKKKPTKKRLKTNPSAYQMFENGAVCTGNDNAEIPRSTKVYYRCGSDGGILTIESIVENPHCFYSIHVASSILCNLSGFAPPQRDTLEINCEKI